MSEGLRVVPVGHVSSTITDPAAPLRGVFATRSADRPDPIGVHRVAITAVEPGRIRVRDLEAVDGTPVLDVKPVLSDER